MEKKLESAREEKAARIRELNDAFRKTFAGGRVIITRSIVSLGEELQHAIIERVKTFQAFNKRNDPYREHNFGAFVLSGARVLWKIDYYDRDCKYGSEKPENAQKTTRVLTIMLADDY